MKIGRYEVQAEIGRGSMGVVYLARDPRLDREVALKTFSLPEGLSRERQEEFRERLVREARAAARLDHPGIVTVYDVDEEPQTSNPFITMEHVGGVDLARRLRSGGGLEPTRALDVAAQVAEALHAAHRAGIVHRDVKPANIILRESDGAVKLADFGVARTFGSELTRSGVTVGSPTYMSPEQIRGQPLDGRGDLFSLAVVLYEMLCGEPPFAGDDIAALGYAIVHETPVPISRRAHGLPSGIDAFFDRALAKDPSERFPDAGAFRNALRGVGSNDADVDPAATRLELRVDPQVADSSPPVDDLADWYPISGPRDPTAQRRGFRRRGVVVALVLLAAVAWLVFGAKEGSYLQLDAKSSAETGTLTLLVDGNEVYSRRLAGNDRGVLDTVLRRNLETFEAWIPVSAGKHEVVARFTAEEGETEYEDTIVVDLESGSRRRLRMTVGRKFGKPLSLKAAEDL